ncbi:hypothetical protein [Nonomuraea sp. NPDC049709]|uniref:hypothetical protein n=1 Tax=Nonomuraea sp. NPDC049709 TaxID=3154736 RepID=UPI00342D597B
MKGSNGIRWIIGSTAAALWVTTALTAGAGVTMHVYLAVLLATTVASCGVLLCLADAMARARVTQSSAAGRAALDASVQVLTGAIDQHAVRMEKATAVHGDRLRRDVFSAERIMTTKWRGEALASLDASLEEAARARGSDTGPLPKITIS